MLGRQFVVRIDGLNGLNKKFMDIIDFSRFRIGKLTKEQAEAGASMAASLAPQYSGALIQAIGWRESKRVNYEIYSRQPKNQRNRPYHLWMHGLGKYPQVEGYIHSGDPKYMLTVYRELKRLYPELIKKELIKTIQR